MGQQYNKKHGLYEHRIYNIWKKMRYRCSNPNIDIYKWYGGKGVKVCEEWDNSVVAFYEWAMANGYADDLTIDRIDSNGDYEPSNCRWITQSDNTIRALEGKPSKKAIKLEYDGKCLTLKEWSEELGINFNTVYKRYQKGWTTEQILAPTQTKFSPKKG